MAGATTQSSTNFSVTHSNDSYLDFSSVAVFEIKGIWGGLVELAHNGRGRNSHSQMQPKLAELFVDLGKRCFAEISDFQ